MSALKPLFLPACADPSGADDDVSAGQSHSLLSLARRPFTGVEGPPSPVPPETPSPPLTAVTIKGERHRGSEGERERERALRLPILSSPSVLDLIQQQQLVICWCVKQHRPFVQIDGSLSGSAPLPADGLSPDFVQHTSVGLQSPLL